MDLQNMDLNGGTLQISTEVIGKIARCAALEVDGVSEVSCGKQNKKVKVRFYYYSADEKIYMYLSYFIVIRHHTGVFFDK